MAKQKEITPKEPKKEKFVLLERLKTRAKIYEKNDTIELSDKKVIAFYKSNKIIK